MDLDVPSSWLEGGPTSVELFATIEQMVTGTSRFTLIGVDVNL